MAQRDEVNRLRRVHDDYLGYLRRISNDLAALIEAGAFVIDVRPANREMLAEHGGFLDVMEEYEDRDLPDSPVRVQERRVWAMEERHRDETRQAVAEGRNGLYLDAVARRHGRESSELWEQCTAYQTWLWHHRAGADGECSE